MWVDVTRILDSDDPTMNPNVAITIGTSAALVFLTVYRSYRRPRTTKLRGSPSNDFIFGANKELFDSPDVGGMYRDWEKTYGQVYQIPSTICSTIIVMHLFLIYK